MPVDPRRIDHIIVEFENPITLDQLRIVRAEIEYEIKKGRLPSHKQIYRAFSDGFGRLVNVQIWGGTEV